MIHYFDRSRIETDHKCPRRLYWEYYFDGRGLQPVKLNQHLAFGGKVHEAIAGVLKYCRLFDNLPNMPQVLHIISQAQKVLRDEFFKAQGFQAATLTEMGFDGEMIQVTNDQAWLIGHYCDLLEALVIGWCLVRLPALMQEYRVVQLETEEQLHLAPELVFNSRPDAILERRTDGALVILSLKTVSQVNQMWLENFKTDQQTISEVLPVEARLGREVAGVQVEGLVKGKQTYDWPVGSKDHFQHSSPLVWGYCIEAGGLDLEWKSQYTWVDEAGNNRRLGKGWNRQPISSCYPGGIAEWVGHMYQQEPELLRAQFPSLPLISRSAHELEEWQTQVKYRETEVANALVQINTGSFSSELLSQVFPKHTGGCAYDPQFHSKCPCYELCWGVEGNDPIGSGRYQYRVPNHPEGA